MIAMKFINIRNPHTDTTFPEKNKIDVFQSFVIYTIARHLMQSEYNRS